MLRAAFCSARSSVAGSRGIGFFAAGVPRWSGEAPERAIPTERAPTTERAIPDIPGPANRDNIVEILKAAREAEAPENEEEFANRTFPHAAEPRPPKVDMPPPRSTFNST
eukprot:tig00021127_g18699.t1